MIVAVVDVDDGASGQVAVVAQGVGKDPGVAELEDGVERLGKGDFGVGEILQGVGSSGCWEI